MMTDNTDEHDRFVTITYFVTVMLGLKTLDWYYDHVNDPGVPQRITVGGRPKLSLRDCIAYQEMLKGKASPPPPVKRKRGRPRKDQAAAA
jgi:hypothetical protein